MNDATRRHLHQIALNFLTNQCGGNGDTQHIVYTLLNKASHYRPAYWRKLRNAISLSFEDIGDKVTANIIKKLNNPVTAGNASGTLKSKKPKKQKRRKQVTEEEHVKIVRLLSKKGDLATLGAIAIAAITGCRPSEMMGITLDLKDGSILIKSTKKNEADTRGLDRKIYLNSKQLRLVKNALIALQVERERLDFDSNNTMSRVQHRLALCTKHIWPRRKHQITLYSYRHQLGSDLKGSSTGSAEAAAIMGHQSTASINKYGNRTRARRNITIRASYDTIANVRVKENSSDLFLMSGKVIGPQ